MLTGALHWHHWDCCLVYCCVIWTDIRIIWPHFAFLGLSIFVTDGIVCPCQNSQAHLFSRHLRSCTLSLCQLLQIYPCLQTILCECMCIFVCVCLCARATVASRLSTWNLTPSLINVRGLSQAFHASFSGDRHIFGLLVTHRVRLGSTLAASYKTNLCHLQPFQAPLCFNLYESEQSSDF